MTADCPTWKSLTALEYHFASTCLPTAEAWLHHSLPPFLLRLATAHDAIELSEAERAEVVNCAFLLYLQLYLLHFGKLSPRERRALTLVEVEAVSYRAAAEDLGIRLENLKMVIFRARRKIHRAMRRVFDGLPPDCRPARDPRANDLRSGVRSNVQVAKEGEDDDCGPGRAF